MTVEEDTLFSPTASSELAKCCANCAAKVAITAVMSSSAELLRTVIDDAAHVPTIHAPRSCHVATSAYGFALESGKLDLAQLILDYENRTEKPKRVAAPRCTLQQLDTGSYTNRTYGHAVSRGIGAARGGKEGNNAFVLESTQQIALHNAVRSVLGSPKLSLETFRFLVRYLPR